ncbi:uncharacterized protein METZ01_LOCUS396959 [marine metagenome]|uniref:Uncharacterized protein n=1 Tax=marine metagenome TaxID=408172 RepID=A0A382VDJ0_9ZZZZ
MPLVTPTLPKKIAIDSRIIVRNRKGTPLIGWVYHGSKGVKWWCG